MPTAPALNSLGRPSLSRAPPDSVCRTGLPCLSRHPNLRYVHNQLFADGVAECVPETPAYHGESPRIGTERIHQANTWANGLAPIGANDEPDLPDCTLPLRPSYTGGGPSTPPPSHSCAKRACVCVWSLQSRSYGPQTRLCVSRCPPRDESCGPFRVLDTAVPPFLRRRRRWETGVISRWAPSSVGRCCLTHPYMTRSCYALIGVVVAWRALCFVGSLYMWANIVFRSPGRA